MTTLAASEARYGLTGMDPARRGRHLARMSADELAERYDQAERDGDQATMAILDEAITAHYARISAGAEHAERARAWRGTQQGQAYTDADREWQAAAHGEYLTAEARCPVLLSAAGLATGRPAHPMLWEASPAEFDRWASDDLKHWVEHGELSVTRRGDYLAAALWTEDRANPRHQVREGNMDETETAPEPGTREWRLAQGHDPEDVDAAERMLARSRARRASGIAPGNAAPAEAAERVRASQAAGTVAVPDPVSMLSRPAGPALIVRQRKIDGAEVMDQGYRFLGHFGIWPSDEARIAAVGFVAQSHMIDAKTLLPLGEHAPHWLNISSEPGSGKTQLAKVMLALCPNGRALVEVTKPALVQHLHEGFMPMIEETDVLFGSGMRNAAIRAIVNACFDVDNYTSYMHNRQKVSVPLFRSLILCGLDKIEKATGEDMKALLSRCHINRMRMAPEGYRPPRFDQQARAVAALLNSRFAAWMAQEIEDGIAWDVPEMDGLPGNRPGSRWEKPLMVADRAGGDWPEVMREACRMAQAATGLPGEDEDASGRIEDYLAQFGITQGEEG